MFFGLLIQRSTNQNAYWQKYSWRRNTLLGLVWAFDRFRTTVLIYVNTKVPLTDLLLAVAQGKCSASMVKETLSADLMKSRAVLVFSLQVLLARNSLTKSLLWRVIYRTMFPLEAVAGCLVTVQNLFDIEAVCVIYRRDLMNIGAGEETGLEATFGYLCLFYLVSSLSLTKRTLDFSMSQYYSCLMTKACFRNRKICLLTMHLFIALLLFYQKKGYRFCIIISINQQK